MPGFIMVGMTESQNITPDQYGRPLRDLRISVTDRCNFRCNYCMPLSHYDWLDRKEILSYEEIEKLARAFVRIGVRKIRLTGGEPLLRRDIETLIKALSNLEGLEDICLTTNGAFLKDKASSLKSAGLKRITVSLDSLKPDRFEQITQLGDLQIVLDGLEAARRAGFSSVKINTVVEKGVNDDEIQSLAAFGRDNGYFIRFIEYMDVGNANAWTSNKLLPKSEILKKVKEKFPLKEGGREDGSAPSEDYEFMDGKGGVGVIASMTEPFCGACSRARLTADGKFVTCLFSSNGFDLKNLLRAGISDDDLENTIRDIWRKRADRYSEVRLEQLKNDSYDPRQRNKIEMIRLGG